MTQPALVNAVNVAKTVFVNSLQTAFAAAATEVVTNVLAKEAGTPLQVAVPGFDAQATIDPTNGQVSMSGSAVTDVELLLAVAKALHPLLGGSAPVEQTAAPVSPPAEPPAPPTP